MVYSEITNYRICWICLSNLLNLPIKCTIWSHLKIESFFFKNQNCFSNSTDLLCSFLLLGTLSKTFQHLKCTIHNSNANMNVKNQNFHNIYLNSWVFSTFHHQRMRCNRWQIKKCDNSFQSFIQFSSFSFFSSSATDKQRQPPDIRCWWRYI